MPELPSLLAFALASFALIVIPGPSVLFVIGRSLALGRRRGLLSVLGNEIGGIPLIAAVALGVGTIISESVMALTVIKVVGACYLVYLGIRAILNRHDHAADDSAGATPSSSWRVLLQGFLVGVTNPKTIIFLVAVLPQFVDHRHGSAAIQMAVLGLIFTAVALVCDGAWALLAGTTRARFARSPKRISQMSAAGGGMMIGLGGVLLVSGSRT